MSTTDKTLLRWQTILTIVASLIGGTFSAGIAYATIQYRVERVEMQAQYEAKRVSAAIVVLEKSLARHSQLLERLDAAIDKNTNQNAALAKDIEWIKSRL